MPSQLIGYLTLGIGLCAIYGLLGVLVSTVQELLASLVSVRASALDLRLRGLLADASSASRLDALSRRRRAWIVLGWGKAARAPEDTASPLYVALQKTGALPDAFTDKRQPSYVEGENFARALVGAIRLVHADNAQGTALTDVQGGKLIEQLRAIIREQAKPRKTSPGNDDVPEWVWNALDTFVSQAGNDISLFRKHIEEWFDLSMDRLNGIYTRWSRVFMVAMGLIIAIAWNINSIDIAKSLLHSADRQPDAIIQAEQAIMTRIASSRCCLDEQTKPENAQNNTGEARNTCANADDDATEKCMMNTIASMKQTHDLLAGMDIPIGWPDSKTFCKDGTGSTDGKSCDETWSETLWKWCVRLLGWLITAFAVSLGSSFWFDTLNSLINIRLTGARPPSKLDESTGKKPAG